ncbi:NT-C2 domain-containing protein [Cephalotus follicularis]|uniref:NT-C2 domain-containing protein n=1 Tax=Cephalotus follicularis TaxID=3775 RepID=A0A1Q3ARW6_CEPFO|nr:NT-C2 domain-containing protein [Cephalotus follicularis]
MMLSKIEPDSHSNDVTGNSYSGQLLHDIEAISKALYLHNTPTISSSDTQHKFAGKTRVLGPNPGTLFNDGVHKDKKSSFIWNLKKPLKALAHLGHHRINLYFFLHVHSIEGLPTSFNEFDFRVNWKRKDEVLRTRPSRVLEGTAEFEETLIHQSCVYGSRSGPHHSAKYQGKLFLLYASMIEAPELDTGKHWVDLTRLLPHTLEDLEGMKSSGKWSTSFKLVGKAKGATLNVSFSFSVMGDSCVQLRSDINICEGGNITRDSGAGSRPSNDSRILRRVGSVPSKLGHQSDLDSQSVDIKLFHGVLPNQGLGLSKSIDFLYQKPKRKPELDCNSAKDISRNEFDNMEFVIVDQGIELSDKEQLKLEQVAIQNSDCSTLETIDRDVIIQNEGIAFHEETNYRLKDDLCSNRIDEIVVDGCKHEESSVCTTEELKSALQSPLNSETVELELTMYEFLEQQYDMDVKSNCKAGRISKSLNLDDVTESVATDFLNMLGIENGPSGSSSDGDPESPRERLLKEFEQEAQASGAFIFDFDAAVEKVESGCTAPSVSCSVDLSKDFDFSLVIQAVEEHEKASQFLRNRWKAKKLEDLETEALMQEWGLNEKIFQSSTPEHSGGFGSPIELPSERPIELPPLGDGFGPFIQTKGGGYLRSMNPALFKNCKNVGSLVMQVSRPIVLPAEMGSEIFDVLQHLASLGIEKLSVQANKLLPVEDITGKMLRQVAQEATTELTVSERQDLLQHDTLSWSYSSGRRKEVDGYHYNGMYDNLSAGNNIGIGYVSLEDLAPLAMDRIQTLSIEGLRIQSGMSDEEAPSSIRLQSVGKVPGFVVKNVNFNVFLKSGAAGLQLLDTGDDRNVVEGLMGLSVTLEEWLQLDAGISVDKDQISEHIIKILAAHHAKCIDLVSGTFTEDMDSCNMFAGGRGLMGNSLTVAFRLLLRDPLRNYEAVGASMLVLVQVERVLVPQKPNLFSKILERSSNVQEDYEPTIKEKSDKKTEEDNISLFKITEVHLAGLNTEPGKKELWGTKTEQQSGTRWLLASGMGKTSKHPLSKSMAIVVRSYPQAANKLQTNDILWSITSNFHDKGTDCNQFEALLPPIRNPDIIFPNESCRSLIALSF